MPVDAGDGPPHALDTIDERRVVIEILSWDWGLHLGIAPPTMPLEYRFTGGLIYTRAIDITGRLVTPSGLQERLARINLSPIAPDLAFGPAALTTVGQISPGRDERQTAFEATLLLPEDALPGVLTCLASVWKYLHLWTAETLPNPTEVTDFAFSRNET